ncbi:unnamed protein product [Bemisia tabaci]|uniref:WW domain-containing protein n=1 Tax=Bemisia tabaci TaxID=7038 RepID=A0A9P0A828_BEMTA|nr:unnamed protein product [Bemisia tabaci]
MSSTSHSIVCKEIFDKTSEPPSEEEIKEYALKIGINLEDEPHLLPLAIDGLTRPLPTHWQPCYHVETKNWYYFNFKTKETIWEHPYDELYRNVVLKARYLAENNEEDTSLLELCKPLTSDFESLEQEILLIVAEEMLPNKGLNLSNNPLFFSTPGSLNRKPTLTPIDKDSKKKQMKNEALKPSAKLSNPLNHKSLTANLQLKDRSLNSSSVISTSGFSSMDSKQKLDLSLYDHVNEYDDDYISSLASDRKTSHSEILRKTSKTESRKGTVRFHLSDKDAAMEDESLHKISIDDVASLGLSTDSGVVSSLNPGKTKVKSSFTLMGGGSAFLKKSGKKTDDKDSMETDGKKECSDNEDSVNSHGAIFDGKKKLMSSKSISAQNLSEFSTKRERPLIRSHTTDAQDCNTLVGDFDEDLFHESIQPSDGLIDHSFQSEDVSDEQSKLLMRKNRSNLIVKDSADRLQKSSTDLKLDSSQSSQPENSIKSTKITPSSLKKVLNIRFGVNELESVSSSASNAFDSQEVSEEESAKASNARNVSKEARNLSANLRRASLLNQDRFDDSLKSDSLLECKDSSSGNFKRDSPSLETSVNQKEFEKEGVKMGQENFRSASGGSHFSHLQGPSGAAEDGNDVRRVLERVQGLWSEEETESAKHTAELVNRLEKSIEDKLKSKKEKTLELDQSLTELEEKLSKLNKYKEAEVEKQSKHVEKDIGRYNIGL